MNKVLIKKGAAEIIKKVQTSPKDLLTLMKALVFLENKNPSYLSKLPKISDFSPTLVNNDFRILRFNETFIIIFLIKKKENNNNFDSYVYILDIIYKTSDKNVRSMLATIH